MGRSVARQLIDAHLVSGDPRPDNEVAIRIDQTLTQDATGTLVMLELEAMDLDHAHTRVSVQYVDHNLVQADHKNPDDHVFLLSACRRFGIWFSRPGNGVSHPVHQEYFGKPGTTLLGADSHTCAAGALGMLAIGAGGVDVAMAIAGEPFYFDMPRIVGIELVGALQPWVSAKDVILELLRRRGVTGGLGRILEYHGPGVAQLSAMDRHVIANMGAELGATTSVFPSDDEVRKFLVRQDRADDWQDLLAEGDPEYDEHERIDLSEIEPMVALPPSPGNVTTVASVVGRPIHQAYIGSSANPGYRDIAIVAAIVGDHRVCEDVSLDINPASRQILHSLVTDSYISRLVRAGARLHQTGCNGCIGMGQAPATGRISLRTVPRNFPGRSGTREDAVYLVSPETAAASALTGVITDPRTLKMEYPRIVEPAPALLNRELLVQPPACDDLATRCVLQKGPNISSLPELDPLPDSLDLPILLVIGDDLSTDEILPAGSRVLPFRSNIPRISEFAFADVDDSYVSRARSTGAHAIAAGHNYGQGSSREHAALAPRYLGLRMVVAKSFARIHRANLINFGVVPVSAGDALHLSQARGQRVCVRDLRQQLRGSNEIELRLEPSGTRIRGAHHLSARQVEILLAGGVTNYLRQRRKRR